MSVQLVHSARPDGHRCLITWGEAMRDTRRVAAALAAGLLLLTACASNDGGSDDAPPIGGDEDEDSDDVENVDEGDEEEPFAVPDEIDEDYAEDVINALLEIDYEVLVTALEQEPGEALDVEATDRLHAILDGARRDLMMERLQSYIDDPASAEGLLPPEEMNPTYVEVDALIHTEPERCILVGGYWNLEGTATDPPDDEMRTVFSLSRVDRSVTDEDRNPTPWAIRDMSPLRDGDQQPIPVTQWDEINFPEDFDRTCENR
jgi:hypothetical protein